MHRNCLCSLRTSPIVPLNKLIQHWSGDRAFHLCQHEVFRDDVKANSFLQSLYTCIRKFVVLNFSSCNCMLYNQWCKNVWPFCFSPGHTFLKCEEMPTVTQLIIFAHILLPATERHEHLDDQCFDFLFRDTAVTSPMPRPMYHGPVLRKGWVGDEWVLNISFV